MSEYEYILCSAIHWDDGEEHKHQPKNITTGWVVCGRRHHNCFVILKQMGRVSSMENLENTIQGFLTSIDRFVDRKEAAQIAFSAKQIDEISSILTSEDLW